MRSFIDFYDFFRWFYWFSDWFWWWWWCWCALIACKSQKFWRFETGARFKFIWCFDCSDQLQLFYGSSGSYHLNALNLSRLFIYLFICSLVIFQIYLLCLVVAIQTISDSLAFPSSLISRLIESISLKPKMQISIQLKFPSHVVSGHAN